MKGNNPPCQQIPLYYSQPSQMRLAREAEAELYYFPPIRDGDNPSLSPSIPACYGPPCTQAAQQTANDSEDALFNFPPAREGNDTPLFPPTPGHSRPHRSQVTQRDSQKPPLSSKEETSSQRHRQPNKGLGRANIVNTVAVRLYVPYMLLLLIANGIYFHQAKSPLKQDPEIHDIADECPTKKRCIVFHDEDDMELVQRRIARLKKRTEKVAAEVRDIASMLEVGRTSPRNTMNTLLDLYIPNPMKTMNPNSLHRNRDVY